MIVFLTVNGVGHGHLQRALIAGSWLKLEGENFAVFFQGKLPRAVAKTHGGVSLRPLYQMPAAAANRVANAVARFSRISSPPLLIEDTHPSLARFPRGVTRILMVRPTEIAHMRRLNSSVVSRFAKVLICDAPDSPTWPYTPRETREILGWPKWTVIGPIFRRPAASQVERLRTKYRVRAHQRLIVCTMGAGGVHLPGERDEFVRSADRAARAIRARHSDTRFLFVCGPLFPADYPIPDVFERIEHEPALHGLLALSSAAIVSRGYNVLWECLVSGVPMLALPTSSVAEPVRQRLRRLRQLGVLAENAGDLLSHSLAQNAKRLKGRIDSSNYLARTRAAFISALPHRPALAHGASPPWRYGVRAHRWLAREMRSWLPVSGRCIIRIADVASLTDPTLHLALQLCAQFDFQPVLDVIPHFLAEDECAVERLRKIGRFEVAQHGYSHLPEFDADGRITGETGLPFESHEGFAALRRGYRKLQRLFRSRFQGGYAAPYDVLGRHLGERWCELGGRYILTRWPGERAQLENSSPWLDLWRLPVRASRPNNRPPMYFALVIRHQELGHATYLRVIANCLRRLYARGCMSLSPAKTIPSAGIVLAATGYRNEHRSMPRIEP